MRYSIRELFLQRFYKIFGYSKKELLRRRILCDVKKGLLAYCKNNQFFVNRLGILAIKISFNGKNNTKVEIETIRQNIMTGYINSSLIEINKCISYYLNYIEFEVHIVHSSFWDNLYVKENENYLDCDKFDCDGCEKCKT